MTRYSWRNVVRSHSWSSGTREIVPPPKASTVSSDEGVHSFSEEAQNSRFLLDGSAVVDRVARALRVTTCINADSPANEKEDDDSTVGYLDGEDYYDLPPDIEDGEEVGLLDNDELNAELRVLKRHVTASSAELSQFRKRVATSRRHRKKGLLQLNRKIDLAEEDPVLPPDTYSFFAITRFKVRGESGSRQCPELTFGIALSVLLLQIITLSFLAVDVIDIGNKHNPLGIPPGVDWTVQVCQLIALFITVISQDEVRVSLNVLFDGYNAKTFEEVGCKSSTSVKWRVSAILRICAGIYSLVLTFILIISSNKVRDLLLNFTAVEFISNVDDTIFLLCSWGYFGPKALRDAEIIANAKPLLDAKEGGNDKDVGVDTGHGMFRGPSSRSSTRGQTRCRFLVGSDLVAIWVAMFIAWIALSADQGSGKFLPRQITVQFGDEYEGALGTFSGLYRLDKGGSRVYLGGRKRYVAADGGTAKFQYCEGDEHVWTFSYAEAPDEEVEDPCATQKRFVRAQSGESDAFDLTRKPLDKWYYRSESEVTQLLPLQHLSIGNGQIEAKDCSSNGEFNGATKVCDCRNGYFGLNCQLGSCHTMQTSGGFFNNETRSWSTKYTLHRKNGTDSPPLQAYNRPVFVGTTIRGEGESDVIFFTGRRWVLSRIKDIASLFSRGFHGHWSHYNISFISEAVDDQVIVDSHNEAAIPTGLLWFHVNSMGDPSPNMKRRSDVILACTCTANNEAVDSFSCLNNGMCLEDGTCECVGGSEGDDGRCEISGQGNGNCHAYFNSKLGGFDGGDCCNATCSNGDKYLCGFNEMGEYIGFPHCIDASQKGNGLCDLSLNTEEHEFDGGDCCEETCGNHSSCGTISESIFGGQYVGYPYCRDPDVTCPDSATCLKWVNLTVALDIGSQPGRIGLEFVCDGKKYGDSIPGTFENEFHRRMGTLVVPDGAECKLLVKGNHTGDGMFKAYYGHSQIEDMLVVSQSFVVGSKPASFRVSAPHVVSLTSRIRRDTSTHPIKLGLQCSGPLQNYDGFHGRELDFDDSGEALETVKVRHRSWCRFDADQKGIAQYELIYEEENENPIVKGQHTNGTKSTVFFRAVSPTHSTSMVQIVANVTFDSHSEHTTVKLQCLTPQHETLEYAREVSEESLTMLQLYIVPKHSRCLFSVADSTGGSYQLHYKKGNDDIIFMKGELVYSDESVFFDASTPPGNVQASTILYDGTNMPWPIALDLRCVDKYPKAQISEETRAIVLMANGTDCNFTTSSLLDTTNGLSCSKGEGYYRVYNGIDMSTDKLLARGSQYQGEAPVSFKTGSTMPLREFSIGYELMGASNVTNSLRVKCDNAPPTIDEAIEGAGNITLKVRDGSSCELSFGHPHHVKSFQMVRVGKDEDDHVVFQGGRGTNSSDTSLLFSANHSSHYSLVQVLVLVDLNDRQYGVSGDDIALSVTCHSGYNAYFNERGHGSGGLSRKDSYTLLVPEGEECEILISDNGNEECCADEKGTYEVQYGNTTISGFFECRTSTEVSIPIASQA